MRHKAAKKPPAAERIERTLNHDTLVGCGGGILRRDADLVCASVGFRQKSAVLALKQYPAARGDVGECGARREIVRKSVSHVRKVLKVPKFKSLIAHLRGF